MRCSIPGFPVLHHLPEFAQTHVPRVNDAIQPSHPLVSYLPYKVSHLIIKIIKSLEWHFLWINGKKTVRNPGRDNAIYLRKMNKLNTMGRGHPSQFKMLKIAVLPLPGLAVWHLLKWMCFFHQYWFLFQSPIVDKWRRQWHPTPVLLPGKSHGQRSLVGCSPWGR